MARHQCGISSLVTQMSLQRETRGGIDKSGLLSQVNLESVVLPSKKNQSFTLTRMRSRKIQTIVNPQNLTPTKASRQAVIF